jgi:glycosyltransferase involved in cell wall biosynthesis
MDNPPYIVEAGVERKPLISVCIATYNQQSYLRDAVMSALAQRAPARFDLEVLVGDDGSTDATPCILKALAEQYGDCLTVLTHSPNIGGTENYQALIRLAKGDYLAHLDGDDYWLPGKLVAQLTFLKANPACTAVYSQALTFTPDGQWLGLFCEDQPHQFDLDYLVEGGNFLNHSSLMYRSYMRPRLLALQAPFIDYRIHIELASSGLLGFLSSPLVLYRVMAARAMTRCMPGLVAKLYFEALLAAAPLLSRSAARKAIAAYFLRHARSLLGTGRWSLMLAEIATMRSAARLSGISLFLPLVVKTTRIQRLLLLRAIRWKVGWGCWIEILNPRI